MNYIENTVSLDNFNINRQYIDMYSPPVIDQPTLLSDLLVVRIRKFLTEQNDSVNEFYMLYFKIDNFNFIKRLYGIDIINDLMNILQDTIQQILVVDFMIDRFFLEILNDGETFFVFNNTIPQDEFELKIYTFRIKLRNIINNYMIKKTGCNIDIKISYSPIKYESESDLNNHNIQYAIFYARSMINKMLIDNMGIRNSFEELIRNNLICSHYQPIINLSNGYIFGWEALVRCYAKNNYFNSSAILFDFAEDIGALFLLEKTCRHSAVRNFGVFSSEQKLFINIHPKTMLDPNFKSGQTLECLHEYGLKPINIVFEITERHSLKDFSNFYRALEHYRADGYGVAIDDVGAGYSGLTHLAEIRPDFIKIDMGIVRDVDTNPVKRSLIESLLYFAEKIGCRVIAEGIERDRELTALVSIGVHYGQGFYIAHPAFPKPSVRDEIKNKITVVKKVKHHLKCSLAIEALVEFVPAVSPTSLIKDIRSYFAGASPLSSVVVVEDSHPIGLIMSYHLNYKLSTQYGVSLYSKRPVTQIMDVSPLIVDASTPIGKVAQDAMSRSEYKIYDNIIVTKHGHYIGIISVQNMFDTLAKLNLEIAKGANPLTGLPGNIAIEQEIEMCLREGAPFSVVYADLDNFKAYNDLYGFKKGDQIILLLARILRYMLKKYGSSRDFVGHVGGDDFVVVIRDSSSVELYGQKVVDGFGRAVRACFTLEDRKRGYFLSEDRHGEIKHFPLTSLSLAVVDCQGLCSLADIAKKAAEVKKYAKSIPGNCWVRDRRKSCIL